MVTLTNKVANNDTETKGVEVEGFWRPGNGFTITVGGGYTRPAPGGKRIVSLGGTGKTAGNGGERTLGVVVAAATDRAARAAGPVVDASSDGGMERIRLTPVVAPGDIAQPACRRDALASRRTCWAK